MNNSQSDKDIILSSIVQSELKLPSAALNEFFYNNLYGRKVVIYGAGAFGKEVHKYLTERKVTPSAFLDSYNDSDCCNLKTYHPSDYADKSVIVVLGIVVSYSIRLSIEQTLRDYGFFNIIDGQVIRAHHVDYDSVFDQCNIAHSLGDVLKPLNYLADNHSIDIYFENLIAHFKRDYSCSIESEDCVQYLFSHKLTSRKPLTYVDCGAYTGDTFNLLVSNNVNIDYYIGFEPIHSNYQALIKTVCASPIKATLLPLAISDSTRAAKFISNTGSSAVSDSGNVDVMYGVLDEILHNTHVDFIKMDIEGDEPNALLGCLQTIKRHKPDLAISVYHKINHFWEIPNWISGLGLGYKLYMRTHSSACMETVLYAVHDR